jgi:hypothetical protein
MEKKPHPCVAHVQTGTAQAVAAALHVLIVPGIDGGYIAQGIEIDYAASGATEDEVREHFAKGFCSTIVSYLRRGRDLNGLFKTSVPGEFRRQYYGGDIQPVLTCAVGVRETGVHVPERAPIPEFLAFVKPARAAA